MLRSCFCLYTWSCYWLWTRKSACDDDADDEALRVTIGCHCMSSIDHLHQETKVLPLRAHSELLTKQYALRCHLPGHPGARHLDRPQPKRLVERDLVTEYLATYGRCMPLGDITPSADEDLSMQDYRRGIKGLHTACVAQTVAAYEPNKVLHESPPEVAAVEKELPRESCAFLVQLRSGYCKRLNYWHNGVSVSVDNVCPECEQSPNDVHHLFNCPEKPMDLTPRDLWDRPREAVQFLDAWSIHMDGGGAERATTTTTCWCWCWRRVTEVMHVLCNVLSLAAEVWCRLRLCWMSLQALVVWRSSSKLPQQWYCLLKLCNAVNIHCLYSFYIERSNFSYPIKTDDLV